MGAKQSRKKKVQQQLNDLQKAMEQAELRKEVTLMRKQLDRVMGKLADLQANATPDGSNNKRQKEPNRCKDTQLAVATPKEHAADDSNDHDDIGGGLTESHDVVSGEEKPEPIMNNQRQGGADVTMTLCQRELFPLIPFHGDDHLS